MLLTETAIDRTCAMPTAAQFSSARHSGARGYRVLPRLSVLACALCACILVMAVLSAGAHAALPILGFDGSATDVGGTTVTQAGAHPDVTTGFSFPYSNAGTGIPGPIEDPKDVTVDLPAGLVGNPSAVTQCNSVELASGRTGCPITSQVGIVAITTSLFTSTPIALWEPVYNIIPPAGVPAEFAFNVSGEIVRLDARVRTGADYGISIDIRNISQAIGVIGTQVTFWGVPADSAHDPLRGTCMNGTTISPSEPPTSQGSCPSPASHLPFMTLPTHCSIGPETTTLTVTSWQDPEHSSTATFLSHDTHGALVGLSGCDRVPFAPSFALAPDTTQADAPAGARAIELKVPQSENPLGLASSDVKEVSVSAPAGVTLNPGAADGLVGCSDAQIALRSATAGDCPAGSVVGSVKIATPLLQAPLEGQVFVGEPECSPCSEADAQDGRLLRLFVQAQGSGVVIKAVGNASLDPVSGRLTVTFRELPQQPFSDLLLTLKGGERGVFINPLACGAASAAATLVPWSGTAAVQRSSSFSVDWDGAGGACPASAPFLPGFSAGSVSPQAAASSAFTATFTRPDRNQVLDTVGVKLPPGLLGVLASVPRCGEPAAAQGTCPAVSRIATARVAAGTGSHPYWFTGPVYLTGPYQGAPFGLSIAVPAVAGPFNLGTIVTRARILVDPRTAQVSIVSDPLPQIVDGIQTHIETVNVTVDRQGFMVNPTGCAQLGVNGTVTSTQGASVPVSSPFRAVNCANLGFKPRLTASVAGRSSRADGAALDVKIASGSHQANIGRVAVSLPKALPSRLSTIQKACPQATFAANPSSCPAGSLVGTATAVTPILAHALSGPAYLVSHGGAAFPDLVLVLQGEGVTVDLTGAIDITKAGITSSTFNNVPDVPISSFELKLPTGPHSALTANLPAKAKGNLCGQTLTMPTSITGQNNAQTKQTTKLTVTGCTTTKKKTTKKTAKPRADANATGRSK